MKIAVFHNYLDNIGGAEVVSLALARGLNADLFTTNVDAENIGRIGFSDVLPRIHSIGAVPKLAPLKRQLALWRFRQLKLGASYDFYIISGDWAMSGAVQNKPNLWYVHSPLNELWQFKDYVRNEMVPWWQRPLYDLWVGFNRGLTRRYAKHVCLWVCNSGNTQERVRSYYGAEAEVIHPPMRLSCQASALSGDYWLSVNRLIPNKRIELQLKAFSRLPGERLIIVGSYEKNVAAFENYKEKLEAAIPSNVTIRHWVSEEELASLYAGCKGLIATAQDEDFGMTPVEAMAFGKPVIAADEGGYRESMADGVTGILIPEIDEIKLAEAITKMSATLDLNPDRYRQLCLNHAEGYDARHFVEKIQTVISRGYPLAG